MLDQALASSAVGSAETVRRGLEAFIARTGADELIVTSQIFDHADGSQTRQLHLLAFHRRRFVDDEHHAGALRRARWSELGGKRALDRIFDRLVLDIDVALASDPQQSAALQEQAPPLRIRRRRAT